MSWTSRWAGCFSIHENIVWLFDNAKLKYGPRTSDSSELIPPQINKWPCHFHLDESAGQKSSLSFYEGLRKLEARRGVQAKGVVRTTYNGLRLATFVEEERKHFLQTATYFSLPPITSTSISFPNLFVNEASLKHIIQTELSFVIFSDMGISSKTLPNGW